MDTTAANILTEKGQFTDILALHIGLASQRPFREKLHIPVQHVASRPEQCPMFLWIHQARQPKGNLWDKRDHQ